MTIAPEKSLLNKTLVRTELDSLHVSTGRQHIKRDCNI